MEAIGKKAGNSVRDQIRFTYQTEKWGKPVKLIIRNLGEESGVATFEATLLDDKGVQILDSREWVRFSIAGDGTLIDNQGTSEGSRYVQLYNGRAIIRVNTNGGKSVVSVKAEGIPSAFANLQ